MVTCSPSTMQIFIPQMARGPAAADGTGGSGTTAEAAGNSVAAEAVVAAVDETEGEEEEVIDKMEGTDMVSEKISKAA